MACIFRVHTMLTYSMAAVLFLNMTGCSHDSGNETAKHLNKYYFNIDRFAGVGEVYVYQSASELALPEEIWHYRYDPGYRGNYLTSMMYTPSGDPVQKTVERLNRDNAELLSLDLYYIDGDSMNAIEAKINQPVTFSFAAIETMPQVNYELEYIDTSSETDSVRVILNKTRQVVGEEKFYFEGKELPAVRVNTREMLETETEGFTETEWTGTEIFAQDVGLVYYRKKINDQFTLEYTLAERITYEEFKNRYIGFELQ